VSCAPELLAKFDKLNKFNKLNETKWLNRVRLYLPSNYQMLLFRWCTVMYILFVFLHGAQSHDPYYDRLGLEYCVCHKDIEYGPCTYVQDLTQPNNWCRDSSGWPRSICGETADGYGARVGAGQGLLWLTRYPYFPPFVEGADMACAICEDDTFSFLVERQAPNMENPGAFLVPTNNAHTEYKIVQVVGSQIMHRFCVPYWIKQVDCNKDSQYCGSVGIRWGNSYTPCKCCDGERVHQTTEFLGPPGGVLYTYSCRPCDAGSMQQQKLHEDYACFPCHAGKYSGQGATVCLSCNPGTYSIANSA
jgi:hypothetical protein